MINKFLACVFILFVSNACDDDDQKCCECLEAQGKSDAYIYPLTPASPEWINLKTGEEMYQACQIPSNILKNMCTLGLIDSWQTYPLYITVFAWPTPQRGIEEMQSNFNGLKELLNRNDAGEKLLLKYEILDPAGYNPSGSSIEKGKYAILLKIFELTMSQKSILDQLNSSEKKDIVIHALKKRLIKESDPLYEPFTDIGDVYLMARVMIADNYQDFINILNNDSQIQFFTQSALYTVESGNPNPREDLDKIVESAKMYLSK